MSFIQRELAKIQAELHNPENGELSSPLKKELYAAQQALSYALDPGAVRSPHHMIMNLDTPDKGATLPLAAPIAQDEAEAN